jgi:hypothetical protein
VNFLENLFLTKIVKPGTDEFLANLKANREANIAKAQAAAQAEGLTGIAAVEALVVEEGKKYPAVAAAEAIFAPEINGFLNGLLAKGEASIPEAYDALVAFVAKEDAAL